MPEDVAPSPDSCPLCGEANGCAMACGGASSPPCWCTRSTFTAELLASVPAVARGKACICQRCAAKSEAPQTLATLSTTSPPDPSNAESQRATEVDGGVPDERFTQPAQFGATSGLRNRIRLD